MENNKLLGADDFARQMREANPTAFTSEAAGGAGFDGKSPPDQGGDKTGSMRDAVAAALYPKQD